MFSKNKDNTNAKVVLLIIMAIVLAIGIVLYFVFSGEPSTGSGGDSKNTFVTLLPIWVAVFVPLFASKQKGDSNPEQKRNIFIVAAIVGALVLASFLALLLIK